MALVPLLPFALSAEPTPPTFMTLPTEIRLKIYEELFSKIVVEQDVLTRWQITVGPNGGSQWVTHTSSRTAVTPRHHLAILSVNKQIRLEARPIAINCPLFAEVKYRDLSLSPIHLPLPMHARHRVCSLVTNRTALNGRQNLTLSANLLRRNEYPNLRYIEFGNPAVRLHVAKNFIKPLLRASVSEFMAPRYSVARFRRQFPRAFVVMIGVNDATVKLPVCLVNHRGGPILNGNNTISTATVIWDRQGVKVVGLPPHRPSTTSRAK